MEIIFGIFTFFVWIGIIFYIFILTVWIFAYILYVVFGIIFMILEKLFKNFYLLQKYFSELGI